MFIVMHCMGMPFNGDTIGTKSLGGSETAAYYAAKELVKQGHRVTLFTTMSPKEEKTYDGVNYLSVGQVTEQAPLGERFHFFASNTLHDVLIIQRHPQAFHFKWASKVNLWWVHDLALVSRRQAVLSMLWNITGVLTVSEFHKKQYAEVYGINPDIIHPITNGIDLSLYGKKPRPAFLNNVKDIDKPGRIPLVYSSRPERGLMHLVKPDGIMERLYKLNPNFHLYVCGYANTTQQMEGYYRHLWARCKELPNVTEIGALSKRDLASLMEKSKFLVYPTPDSNAKNFEEVSCITAMEAMAAGTVFVSSVKGALPETCDGSGSVLIPLAEDGEPDIDAFVDTIANMSPENYSKLVKAQLDRAPYYDWSAMVERFLDNIVPRFFQASSGAKLRHLIRTSDIAAAKYFADDLVDSDKPLDAIEKRCLKELAQCYEFFDSGKLAEHYKAYYEYEKQRGVNYGPEELANNGRFEFVSGLIRDGVNPEGVVLDYGCAHGHYTINLAKRFPKIHFIGVDITATNIQKARDWAEKDGVKNVTFEVGQVGDDGAIHTVDASGNEKTFDTLVDGVIAAEVIEHVPDAAYYIAALTRVLKHDGRMIITVPYGPWEAQGYEEHHPWRAHVHHFDREDLKEMLGHLPEYSVAAVTSGADQRMDVMGSYVVSYTCPKTCARIVNDLDYTRKFSTLKPRETVSLCILAFNAEADLLRALESVASEVDEVVIAVDANTTDNTMGVINEFQKRHPLWPAVRTLTVDSPLEIGFDEARNECIKHACGDWVMWMDCDEVVVHKEQLAKYLNQNHNDGYAVAQHHFAVDPLGVIKTDLPCRLFRNHRGVKFYGVVHEHPEKELNEGVGFVTQLPDLQLAHYGYTTEPIRRKRFKRNIDLLVRDREKYPNRRLGRYLWVRDIAQLIKYTMETTGGQLMPAMLAKAEEGIKLWEAMLDDDEQSRMLVESLDYYSFLVEIMGEGFNAAFTYNTSKFNLVTTAGRKEVNGRFYSKDHFKRLLNKLVDENIAEYDSSYY